MSIGPIPTGPDGLVRGPTITVSGAAECEVWFEGTEEWQDRPGAITEVAVRFGELNFVTATPTGPVGRHWTSWTTGARPIAGVVNDSLQITARVTARHAGKTFQQLSSPKTVLVDRTPPVLNLTTPGEMTETVDATGKASFQVEGSASDERSAVVVVETAVDGGQFTAATPKAPSDWSQWTATVHLSAAGQYQLSVRARDQEGNLTPATRVTLNAVEPFEPRDPAEIFEAAAYLDDLLRFVRRRFTDGTGAALDEAKLHAVYKQRFGELCDPRNRAVAIQVVHQQRVSVEVLRAFLTAAGKPLPETGYRQQAYEALLSSLATSVEEIRRTRGDDAARAALATRLGLDRPDRLDDFPLTENEVTEPKLEELFGLVDTGRDLLEGGLPPQPVLLSWQLARLVGQWQTQDDAARVHGDAPAVVIDPDLLGKDDFRNQLAGDTAFSLWEARTHEVADDLIAIKNLREAQPTPLEGFDAVAGQFVAAIADLKVLLDDHRRGVDIRPQLDELRLSLAAFLRLMRTRKLAESETLLDADWPDVDAIVAYVKKIGRYPAWRLEEQNEGIVLGPGYFSLSAVSPPLPAWRTSPKLRRSWLAQLRARADGERGARDALQQIVDAAEERALPILRDALIEAVDAVSPDQPARSLLIDLKGGSARKTTRLAQAIETLQGVPFAVRVGGFAAHHPAAGWRLNLTGYREDLFDADWVWWGSHETWRAALRVFIYPTALLSPTQRSDATPAFMELITELRAQPALTRRQAGDAATRYLEKIRQQVSGLPSDFALTEQLTDTQLAQRQLLCMTLFGAVTDPHQAPVALRELFYYAPLLLALQLHRSGEYLAALDWDQTVYAYHLPSGRLPASQVPPGKKAPEQRQIYYGLRLEEDIETKFERLPEWPRKNPGATEIITAHDIVRARARALSRFVVISLVQSFAAFGDAEFTRETDESLARARSLYENALEVLDREFGPPGTADEKTLPFGPDPVPDALRARVDANLHKLRLGRNIAGLERPAPAEATAIAPRQPTPYRFAALIARAKELTQLAGQTEAAMLAALEKHDAEAYNLLKARQDIELARESVSLQDLRVDEARDGVRLATLQRQRADIHVDHFDELLNESSHVLEVLGIPKGSWSEFANIAAGASAAFAGGFVKGGSPVAGFAGAAGAIFGGLSSLERQEEDWRLQRDLARQDVRIGRQQVELARDHVAIARQELTIAGIQAGHAAATADFLARKFTNVELYEFMSQVLAGVYRFLLQQATATAKLAEDQLAFERQQPSRWLIKGDYWEVPVDGLPGGGAQDRRGLTGAGRLLADLVDLDQQAFLTDRRRLQLTRAISLARLDPVAFERFRSTGVMVFGTPESLFDENFPGHYLRLVKQLRLSIIALIPPIDGIRATLTSPGVSRTVVSDSQGFRAVAVRRDPETVAFSAAQGATGMFTLLPDAHPELLRPFEGSGVDAIWRLELPKPANSFDYSTLADVIVEFDYEALHSPDYRQQVIQRLGSERSADRPYSLRQEFPDQWYDLHNPDQTTTPMTVRFSTGPADYPPNLDEIEIQHLALYVAGTELSEVELHFLPDGAVEALGGTGGPSLEGLISTRRPNGASWLPIIGLAPYGTWELKLADSPELRDLFAQEQIEDILLNVTYAGRLPDWQQ